jgi:transcription elongation GreA/GreB family factor
VSRAFVKELDGLEAEENLPELRISEHRNLVTARGLELIEAEVRRLEAALGDARAAQDGATIARLARDLRYWTARRSTAEVAPLPADASKVRFGTSVTLRRADGIAVTYRIVGEDEAAPAEGRISYVSPLARALLGHGTGETVPFAESEAEIIAISP